MEGGEYNGSCVTGTASFGRPEELNSGSPSFAETYETPPSPTPFPCATSPAPATSKEVLSSGPSEIRSKLLKLEAAVVAVLVDSVPIVATTSKLDAAMVSVGEEGSRGSSEGVVSSSSESMAKSPNSPEGGSVCSLRSPRDSLRMEGFGGWGWGSSDIILGYRVLVGCSGGVRCIGLVVVADVHQCYILI